MSDDWGEETYTVEDKERDDEIKLFGEIKNTGINYRDYDKIPVTVNGEDVPPPAASFADMKLPQLLMENVTRCQYKQPTPAQRYAIPIVMAGRDLIASAQTGSGKTAAFMFGIIARLLNQEGVLPAESAAPRAVVVAPTRELAVQIFQETRKFCFKTELRPCVVYGGQPKRHQRNELVQGCDILIGTPGRMNDFLEHDEISLENTTHLVLDEADRMLDMGFIEQIRSIINDFNMKKEGRQTLMFSATFADEVKELANLFQTNSVTMSVGRVGSSTDLITQQLLQVPESSFEKQEYLLKLIRSHPTAKRILVFVERKATAIELENHLESSGFYVTSIHGDRDQEEREEALASFARGHFFIMVATDVAARGLDVDGIDIVINYDMPKYVDSYVHRIGRTGRCGRRGVAVSFVNDHTNEKVLRALADLLAETNQLVPEWLARMESHGRYSDRDAPVQWCEADGTGEGGRYGTMEDRDGGGGFGDGDGGFGDGDGGFGDGDGDGDGDGGFGGDAGGLDDGGDDADGW